MALRLTEGLGGRCGSETMFMWAVRKGPAKATAVTLPMVTRMPPPTPATHRTLTTRAAMMDGASMQLTVAPRGWAIAREESA